MKTKKIVKVKAWKPNTYSELMNYKKKQKVVSPKKYGEKAGTFRNIENKFVSTLDNMASKFMLYFAFIHVLRPFYLDRRGDKKRRALIRFLQLTDSEERFIIENLTNTGLIGRVGDLIFVIQKENALTVFNHYINNNHLNLQEITQLFSQNEN